MKYSSVLIHFTFLKMRAVCEILEEAVKLNTGVSSRINITNQPSFSFTI